jgi:hypothetical protein
VARRVKSAAHRKIEWDVYLNDLLAALPLSDGAQRQNAQKKWSNDASNQVFHNTLPLFV